jgi:hypothetical protein
MRSVTTKLNQQRDKLIKQYRKAGKTDYWIKGWLRGWHSLDRKSK